MTQKQKYREGSWFVVPLESSEYAVGLVARKSSPRGVLLVYFFGKLYSSIPDLDELKGYEPTDAIIIPKVGDLGIINGEWKLIGELPNWDRSKWTIPNFVRREPILGCVWLVKYSDDNPNLVISEKRVTEDEVKNLEVDGLWGYKFAQKRLLRILKP